MFHVKQFITQITKEDDKILKTLIFLLVFSLFSPIRHIFEGQNAYILGYYSDFTSYSLYLSDILIVVLLGYAMIIKRPLFKLNKSIVALFIIIFLSILANFNGNLSLQLQFFSKFIELLALYFIFSLIYDQKLINWFIKIFIAFSLVQVVIIILQFSLQSSIGLYVLGESHLSPIIIGVAKVVSYGTRFIRPYGTFPHPNILAAFLFTGNLFQAYLFLNEESKKLTKYLYLLSFFALTLGLFLTFSRAGVLGLLVSWSALVIVFWIKKAASWIKWLAPIMLLALFLPILTLKPFYQEKLTVVDESTNTRVIYLKTALNMIRAKPVLGLGGGVSLLHMEQFAPKRLAQWQIQPIHNYFLLAAAELGLAGLAALLWIFGKTFWLLAKKIRRAAAAGSQELLWQASLVSILGGYFFLMLFDHYFYTLEQGQLLLWLILGLAASQIDNLPADADEKT